MQSSEVDYVRKGDHHVELVVPHTDDQRIREFLNAIHIVEPSFVRSSLLIEVFQPLLGRVVNTICTMVKYGVPACTVSTLLPNRPDLSASDDRGHLTYSYQRGKIVDHRHQMTHCVKDAEDLMLHEIEIEFDEFSVTTNEWDAKPGSSIVRPKLSLIVDQGDRIEAVD